MIARAGDRGLQVQAAFENEFYLLRPDTAEPTPVDGRSSPRPTSWTSWRRCWTRSPPRWRRRGSSRRWSTRVGPGQFELPIRYADALAAADHQVVFRETVRAVAQRHGLIASFLPKIFEDKAGSGAHLHFSLWRGGRNLTADAARPDHRLGPKRPPSRPAC